MRSRMHTTDCVSSGQGCVELELMRLTAAQKNREIYSFQTRRIPENVHEQLIEFPNMGAF